MRRAFLTFFYTGLLPKAPGTWGTLAGAAVGALILYYLSLETLFLSMVLITIIAVREIDKEEAESGIHDASEIVIDEVAGIWLAMAMSGATLTQIVLSIIYFRILDIWKPSVIGRVDKHVKGGMGVMGDDLLAGVFAGILSAGTYQVLGYFHLL
ncbi:MAG: phosphatidylglycerophosphatase A [Epsilonproteobacteria bacterium]|nr:phosphatidylglycerophosphatase A [Campylobacterota bacterium]